MKVTHQDTVHHITGNIFTLVQKTCSLIRDLIQDPSYPYVAIEEALSNALVHRDYLDTSRGVHVDIKDNCIEVSNPGALVAGNKSVRYNNDKNPERRNAWLYERILIMDQGRHFFNMGNGISRMKNSFTQKGKVQFINLGSRNLFKVILPRQTPYFSKEEADNPETPNVIK